jgi:hypothetical protein
MTVKESMFLGVLSVGLIAGCKGKDPAAEKAAPSATIAVAAASVTVAPPSTPSSDSPGSSDNGYGCDLKKAGDCEQACFGGTAKACGFGDALLRKAAPQGDNPAKRIELNAKGCALGDGKSCSRLGNQYDQGDGVAKNPAKAVEAWESACAKDAGNGCYQAGTYYGDPGTDRPQDMAKWETLLTKACTLGVKAACESKDNPILVVGIEDIVASPAKFTGKHVYLKNVAVRRGSPTSGVVLKPGGSPALDGVPSTIADNADETRRKWARLPTPVRGVTVKFVEAAVEKQMARDERVRFIVMDIGDVVP